MSIEPSRVLVVRHALFQRDFYQIIENWARHYLPDRLDVQDLPFTLSDEAIAKRTYGAMVPWLQDPVQQWSQETYDQTLRLESACDAQGLSVVNRVENLANAGKSRAARLMAEAGVQVPRMALITDVEEFRATLLGFPLPLFVREDWGHGGHMLLAETHAQARAIPVGLFKRPVAVQWIDTRGTDGLFRKYRYLAAGDVGVSYHLHCSAQWINRPNDRIFNEETRALELDYVGRLDEHHALFQRARRALALDMVAFDYALTRDDVPIVWEANPFPCIRRAPHKMFAYHELIAHRSIAAIVRLYLRAGGMKVSDDLEDFVAYRRQELSAEVRPASACAVPA